MYGYSVFATTDEQAAQFSAFFVRQREQFNKNFKLEEALIYLLSYIEQSYITLSYNTENKLIAASNYWIYNDNPLEAQQSGDKLYISSALIVPEERSSRVFMHGFRDMINELHRQFPHIQSVSFSAQVDNDYLNNLYRKFASFEKEIDGGSGRENMYVTSFHELRGFLNRLKLR